MDETRRNEAFEPAYHIDYLPTLSQGEPSNLEKFIGGIKQLFGRQENVKPDSHLAKVKKLQTTANGLLAQLKATRDALEAPLDAELFLHIKAVVGAMEQSVCCIHEMLGEPHDIARQVRVYELYMHWMAKAKMWNERLSINPEDRQEMITAAVAFVNAERIDRDIRSIRNYPSRQLAEKWHHKLEPALERVMQELNQLKGQPGQVPLEKLSKWKTEIDLRRGESYNQALKIIDTLMQTFETSEE